MTGSLLHFLNTSVPLCLQDFEVGPGGTGWIVADIETQHSCPYSNKTLAELGDMVSGRPLLKLLISLFTSTSQ